MKIGILTVPFNNNYGGLLQAYALKTILVQAGHDVIFINRRRNEPKTIRYKITNALVKVGIIKDKRHERKKTLSIYTDLFIRQYLTPLTKEYVNSKDIRECNNYGFNCIIVGSDQVWRYKYAKDSIFDYFLGFANSVTKISYAASFGVESCDFPIHIKDEVAHYLADFKSISVREETGKSILTSFFNIPDGKIKVVLDPTLLLTPTHYKLLIKKIKRAANPYLFTYILDESTLCNLVIKDYQHTHPVSCFNIKAQTGNLSRLCPIRPVEEWINGLCYADFVITDSFHGTVFSILFNKPFVVCANIERGISRLMDLLKIFNLEHRLVTRYDDIIIKKIFDQDVINWDYVNIKISQLREDSLAYLFNSIKSTQND